MPCAVLNEDIGMRTGESKGYVFIIRLLKHCPWEYDVDAHIAKSATIFPRIF